MIRLTASMQEISGFAIVKKMGEVQSKYEGFLSRRWGRVESEYEGFFASSSSRVNEQPALIVVHTLFMREHNRFGKKKTKAYQVF